MGVLDGFFSTWSNAKATFGEGTPQGGAQLDGSGTLNQLKSKLDSAAPGARWTGTAATAYGTANTEHQRVIGELAGLDKRLAAHVDESARIVSSGRDQLDGVRKWVVDAAGSVPNTAEGQRMLIPIANKGIGQVADIVQKTNGDLNTLGGKIRDVGNEYTALGNQKFAPKDGTGDDDVLGVKGNESDEDVKKRAEEDVRKTLKDGDQGAAGRVDEVLHGIKPYQPLSEEQAAYLHQMQAQQKGMSIQDIHAAEQQLGDHKNVIGDSWQLMSNDDVKYDNPDHPGEQITGSRDQLPDHVKTMMGIGTIADDFNRTGETEVKDMSEIIKDGRSELQTGTEVDRGMIELSDRLMDNQTPTNEAAVRGVFDSAGRDHQIITDQLVGRNEGGRDGFLHDINTMNWQDGGKSAGNLFEWTHDAKGPETGIAAEAASRYADYLGNHKELLTMPGFGDQTLGQHNPDLVRAYAHGLTPYMADIAGVSGGADDAFHDLDKGNPDKPLAKTLFAVLGTDQQAYVEFNGAADQLGLDKAHQWAEDVKNHVPVSATDPRIADAAVLKGLVDSGTAEGLHARGLNDASALEWRKQAYDAGVTGLSALGGPVGGPAIEVFGHAMESSVLGPPPDTGGGHPPDISPDEAARYAANALVSDQVRLNGLDQYMIDGKLASVDDLNAISRNMDHTRYNDLITQALNGTMGQGNTPMTNFQFYYNQTVSSP